MPSPFSPRFDRVTAIATLIAQRTGLYIREQDRAQLGRHLQSRCRTLRLASLAAYEQLLAAATPASDREWSGLSKHLSNTESYFFRDRGQFQLLEKHLLPDLITRQRPQRQLRLWSAGCATGEEPYSLAILLQRLWPELTQWDCQIIGTDINLAALAQAA
ncbi:MAG: chemotaxis protein CheR, partial [Spirulinaceae cyanobacterium RM2_2_10]|nr:chemotaxis protein CheR [Spirulinaceae cyanobacterium RM2_2_10]